MPTKLHIDNWISKAELDYYIMFVKAWIPLNAWYYNEYSTKNDSEALDKIKITKNKIRNKIESLLKNDDISSKRFKYSLSELHQELEKRSIVNYGNLISFKNLVIDGMFPDPVTDLDKKGNLYKAIPHKQNGYKVMIVKGAKTLMDRTFNPYSLNSLITDNQFISLTDANVKERIKQCFIRIDPKRPINLISNSKSKSDFILLDADSKVKFVNNTELIAKALIQVLYALRCVLFHGELDPTDANQAVYEHAYNILKPIIKELK